MANIFHPSMNAISRVSIFGMVFVVGAVFFIIWFVVRSPYWTEEGVAREQTVPFSHQHHVGDAGIDCRYCHTSVDKSSFAGVPSTSICMNCHAYLWNDQPMLKPVRDSYRDQTPIRWTRVHDLGDYAFFNHSIHLHKGIGCVSCHGRVDEMPLMWKNQSLLMEWCLACHRDPIPHLRPRQFVYDMRSLDELAESGDLQRGIENDFPEFVAAEPDLQSLRLTLARRYNIQSETNCSICHR